MSNESTTESDEQSSEQSAERTSTEDSAVSSYQQKEEREPVDIERGTPRLTQILATGLALLGTALTAPFALLAIPFGLSGSVMVGTSLFKLDSNGWLSIGTALILTGAIITGAYGALPAELMLIGIGVTILAWDVGQHGITIGQQLGKRSRTKRLLLVHAAISTFVIGFVSFIAYFVFLFAGDGQPAPAVVLIVLGVIVLAWMFRS